MVGRTGANFHVNPSVSLVRVAQFYEGRLKTRESRNAIPIPEDVIPIIEA
jgi:hypothetical protein